MPENVVPVNLGVPGITDAVKIGHGGFATVYRAYQPHFDRPVAVKVLENMRLDDAALMRFERECTAIGRLSGRPYILDVHEGGTTATGKPYLLMAFMGRGSLDDEVKRHGPMPWRRAVDLGLKVAVALESAHQANILHLDVKPANILLTDDDDPKLADFGIARLTSAARTNLTGIAFSPEYAPPEVMRGEAPTVAVDVYSLAATMFGLIAGRPPFVEHPAEDRLLVMHRTATEPVPDLLRPRGVPEAVCQAITRAMAKDPADRPASAAELAATLRAASARAAPTVDDRDTTPLPDDGTRGHRRVLVLLVLGLVLIALWVPASLVLDDPRRASPVIIAGVLLGMAAQVVHLRSPPNG